MPDTPYSRISWPEHFPDVIVHATYADRQKNPHYAPAKAGDSDAAYQLVFDLMNQESLQTIEKLIEQSEEEVILAAVTAIETTGFNAIPDAMATVFAEKLDLYIDTGELRQINKVGHTKASGWHRFVTQAEFTGQVLPGAHYLLVDDHIGFGGTFANLRGYIAQQGGKVIGMTTLTETRDAKKIALQKATLHVLLSQYGQELSTFWQETFGYSLECFTELEASYLCRQPSFDSIRGCLAEAAEKAREYGLWPVDF